MEVEYRREMNENRIWLTMPAADAQTEEAGRWQFRMIQENRLQGILPAVSTVEDGKRRFGYEISTYTPLTEYLPSHRVETPFLRELLWQIQETASLLTDYLLSPDLLVLDPACVFTDGRGRFFFCLLPCSDVPLKTGLKNLLRSLLDYLNYENREETMKIYGLYRVTNGRNYRLEDLFSYLREDHEEEPELPSEEEDLPPWEEELKRGPEAGPEPEVPGKKNRMLYWLILAMGLTLVCGIGWLIFRETDGRGALLQCAAVVLGEAAGGILLFLHRDELHPQKKRGGKALLAAALLLTACAGGLCAHAAEETETLSQKGYFLLEVTGLATGEEADLEGIQYEVFREGSSEPLGTVTTSTGGLAVSEFGLPLTDGSYVLKMKKPSPGIVYSAKKIRFSLEASHDAEHPLLISVSVEEKQGKVRVFLDATALGAKNETIRLLTWNGTEYAEERQFTAEEANEGCALVYSRTNEGRFALAVGEVYYQEFRLEESGEILTFLLGGISVSETAAAEEKTEPVTTAAAEETSPPETSDIWEEPSTEESSTTAEETTPAESSAEPEETEPSEEVSSPETERASVSTVSVLLFLSLALLYTAVIACGGKTVFEKRDK